MVLPVWSMGMLAWVPSKDPISADVMTELTDLLSSYHFSTSGGKEEVLKFTSGVYGASGGGPVPVPVGVTVVLGVVAGVGATGVDGLNAVKAMPVRSSGMDPGIK